MTTLVKTNLAEPVGSERDLINYLSRGSKPQTRWGVGAEMEKLVLDAETGEAASFARVESLLQKLESTGRWRGIREEGHLVALMGETSSLTLEPGGQLELSGKLCPDIHCCYGDFMSHIDQIVGEAKPLGLRFLGLGVQPFTPLDKIAWVPKARYGVMGPYMLKRGDMGQGMMKQSASLQVNLDYADEADCIAKLRIALALSPLLYALFANSPLMDGRPTGFLSTRGEIWSRTDPDRTGLLPQMFRPGAGFATYVEYALDVPMYFIVRDGRFLALTGDRFPFRRFLAEGFEGHRATLADWDLHLSTLFPEARLRPQIEVRGADSLPPRLTLAVAALAKGLLYDEAAREEIWSLFREQDEAERETLYRQSWRTGLKTPMGKRTLREVARDALVIARAGLERQQKRNRQGRDEGIYLDEIQEIAEEGVTLAERLLSRWKGSRKEKLAALVNHCGFDGGTPDHP
jgi:glutamate--cysteine ligase